MAQIISYDPRASENENIRNISETYDLFLFSRTVGNRSSGTLKYYKDKKNIICDWFSQRGLHDLSKATHQDIRLFLASYQKNHTNSGTFKVFSVFRTFINWYWIENDINFRNPIDKIEMIKNEPEPQQGISLAEINAMLEAAKLSKFPERDAAIVHVLSDTGIRKTGFCSLRFQDVDIEKGEIRAFGKNQKWSTKPLGTNSRKALKRYFDRITNYRPSEVIWMDRSGKPMNPDGIGEVLTRLQLANNVEKPFLFHGFRRFYGLALYEATGDIYFVSRMLDHCNVEVTKRYLNIKNQDDLNKAVKLSPMDNRRRR